MSAIDGFDRAAQAMTERFGTSIQWIGDPAAPEDPPLEIPAIVDDRDTDRSEGGVVGVRTVLIQRSLLHAPDTGHRLLIGGRTGRVENDPQASDDPAYWTLDVRMDMT